MPPTTYFASSAGAQTAMTIAAAALLAACLLSVPSSHAALTTEAIVPVAKAAQASIVNIVSVRKTQLGVERPSIPFFEDPFFRRFFGEEFERRFRVPRERREQGLGSGVIATADGYIVTAHHVVEQAEEIKVLLPDKRSFAGKLIGSDPKTDVAVIKIEASGLPVLPWGDSSRLEVGEVVLAIGNPFGLNQTVTMGIISAVGRANVGIVDYEDFIQTDAAINPGNSGGALVNLKGELIGINTAIFTRTGGYMGIGFAIPSNMAKSVMTSLIKHGKVVRGWLGVSIQEVTQELAKEFGAPDLTGALVTDVTEDSPAGKAGLKRGDLLTAFNKLPIRDPVHLRGLVAETPPGTIVVLSVLREKKALEVRVTIGEQPREVAAVRGPLEALPGEHALAGVTVEPLTREDARRLKLKAGVVVSEVDPESPAAQAGLLEGDVIREINRKPVRSIADFERIAGALAPKARALLLITRGRATVFLSITPG